MSMHSRDERQARVRQWAVDTFGPQTANDPGERIRRFAEEAVELVQAAGLPKQALLDLVNYVYSRPAGEPEQEVGGVSFTLLAYCEHQGFSAEELEQREVERVLSKPREHFRARQDAKAAAGVGRLSSPTEPQ